MYMYMHGIIIQYVYSYVETLNFILSLVHHMENLNYIILYSADQL